MKALLSALIPLRRRNGTSLLHLGLLLWGGMGAGKLGTAAPIPAPQSVFKKKAALLSFGRRGVTICLQEDGPGCGSHKERGTSGSR